MKKLSIIKKLALASLALAAVIVPSFSALAAGDIGVERAQAIALQRANLSANQVRHIWYDYDYDDGRYEYEFEFYHAGIEYEVSVDAATGNIFEYSAEYDD